MKSLSALSSLGCKKKLLSCSSRFPSPQSSPPESLRKNLLLFTPHNFWLHVETGNKETDTRKLFEGSKSTLLIPASLRSNGMITSYTHEDFAKLRVGWKSFKERTGTAMDGLLAEVEPKFGKNEDGTIEFAKFEFEAPIAGGALFTKSYLERIRGELGDEILLIVPHRFVFFAFSTDPRVLNKHGTALRKLYESNLFPVSREVFLVNPEDPVRAIGQLGE